METRLQSVFTAMPGVVNSYDAGRQCVDVIPCITVRISEQDGATDYARLPVLQRVPVVFFGGANGRLTTPVAVGDGCLLVFAGSDIGNWKSFGGTTVDPTSTRLHHPADAFAIVGLFDFAHVPTPAPATQTILHSKYPVLIGSVNAANNVARKADTDAIIGCLTNTAVVSGIAAASLDSGASFVAAVNSYFATHPAPGSQKVFVDS